MISKSFAIVLLAGLALAAPEKRHEKRQATDPAQFSSAVNNLIAAYIPANVALPIGAALQSAASAAGQSGDLSAIVQSALAAETPPPYLTAIPSQYQPNIQSLGSAISELRGVASSGIPGAPVLGTDSAGSVITTGTLNAVTTTDTAGATIVGVTGPVTDSAGSTLASITSTLQTGASAAASSASQPTGGVATTDSAGSTITGLAVTTTDSAGSTITSLTTTFPSGSNTDTINSVSGSTSTDSAATTTTETSSSTSSETATSTESTTETTSGSETSAAPTSTSGAAVPGAIAPGAGSLLGLVALLAAL